MNTGTDGKKDSGLDIEALVVLGLLIVTGLIPVVSMIWTGTSDGFGSNLGFTVVIAALTALGYEFFVRTRRRRGGPQDQESTKEDQGECQ